MEDLDALYIKKKARSGVLALTSRTAVLNIIAFISNFLLSVILLPEIFGVFFVVSAAVSFLTYFSDIGLAAALVQKKEQISEDDFKTTFTIQFLMVFTIVILAYGLSSKVAHFYNLDTSGLWLFRVLLIAFLLSSFKTIPSIILERKLDFNKFVIPQIIETIFFYGSVVVLAFLGWGITSFTVGVLLRAVSGLIAIYILVPWIPRFGFNKNSAKKLLHFGVPFQLNSVLALIKDDLLTVYLGKTLGFTQVGYIGWAKKWAEMPLRLIMDNINKVSFPTFSRLQNNRQQIATATEKVLFFVVLLTIPLVSSGIIVIDSLVAVIPKYSKWVPALTSFYLFSLGVIFASISSLLTNVIQSLAKVKITLKLMVMWTILTWLLIPYFIKIFGFNGVSLAMLLISLTSIVTVLITKKLTHFSVINAFSKPLIIGLITSLVLFLVKIIYPTQNIIQIIVILLSGFFIYCLLNWLFVRKEILSILK